MLEMPEPCDKCQRELQTVWNQSKKEKSAADIKVGRSGKSAEPSDVKHGGAESGVCSAGFWPCFGPVLPHCAPFLRLQWQCTFCALYVQVCNLPFDFTGVPVKKTLSLRRDSELL